MLIPKGEAPAPEFGRTWINSGELTLGGLRGRAVLVDFWDYTCVNCLHTLPYVVEWDKRYRAKGLTILGVHAPEFPFARAAALVEKAVRDYGITYPVALDNDYQIWRAFHNRYWPAKYLIDKDGFVRYTHFGEGNYQETEEAIQAALREINPQVELPTALAPLRDTDKPGAYCYRVTPELYCGTQRGRPGNPGGFKADEAAEYNAAGEFKADTFYLGGSWLAREEFLESAGGEGATSRLVLPYVAKEVNLVMAPHAAEEFRVRLRQNGAALKKEDAGADVEIDANGEAWARVREPKLYRLVNNATFGGALLELEVARPGLGLYAFTFVSCVAEE